MYNGFSALLPRKTLLYAMLEQLELYRQRHANLHRLTPVTTRLKLGLRNNPQCFLITTRPDSAGNHGV